MIRSMTGFGKAEATLENGKIYAEIRSLNGKTADIGIKTSLLPKDKEMCVRKMIAKELERGNIDLFMTYEPNAGNAAKSINSDVVLSYYRQIVEIGKQIGLENRVGNDLLLNAILRMPDVVDMKSADIINDGNWPIVEKCISEAIANLNEFREKEGAILYNDVTAKVSSILAFVDEVEKHEEERISAMREKILSRFAELKLEPDQSRLEAEMIYYIEKLDINEEKVRLRQHCRYFMDTISNDAFPGKKLGFIAQEMGREINTTGSKANNPEIQKIVVRMKDELEKIKEQSLNIL
ncbi:MAG: YicC family protein [Bacteroidales bacterium]|nr:YicC family protein [Bacteroidales bacterium]MDE7126841.1 YicC family protein [Bacteroidales bacterium]